MDRRGGVQLHRFPFGIKGFLTGGFRRCALLRGFWAGVSSCVGVRSEAADEW